MKNLCAALLGLLLASAAQAQSVSWPPPAGSVAFLCVYNLTPPTLTTTNIAFAQCDSAGNLRVSGTLTTTPSGTQNVNLTQILNAAPSLTNPLWVFPATGATFPVSGTVTTNTPTTGGTFPNGATPTTASATGTTGATTATLAAVSAKFTYLCGFTITSDATAAVAGTATVTGIVGGTMSFIQNVGAATAAGILSQTFNPCLQSSAVNTAVAINSVAAGVGGNTAVTGWGYQQ